MGPTLGLRYLSKLSRVEELANTNSTWNLKNEVITTKNAICTIKPMDLIIVWNVNFCSDFAIDKYYCIISGI